MSISVKWCRQGYDRQWLYIFTRFLNSISGWRLFSLAIQAGYLRASLTTASHNMTDRVCCCAAAVLGARARRADEDSRGPERAAGAIPNREACRRGGKHSAAAEGDRAC